MIEKQVPILRLGNFQQGTPRQQTDFSEKLFEALQRFGFVIIREHGIPSTILERSYELVTDLFAQPDNIKQRYRTPDGHRGYTPFGTEKAKDSDTPDLKEFWHIGPERAVRSHLNTKNVWPDRPFGFQETLSELFTCLHRVGEDLLKALTHQLGVTPDFFANRIAEGDSVLRLLHYPPVSEGSNPKALRAAAHEDINLITILVAAQGAGLELLDRDGTWLPIENAPGDLIVDTGDMMARLTNEVLPSTTHRVVNPKGPNVSRYSMPFFMHLDADTPLTCLPSCVGDGQKHPTITAGAYLLQRLEENGVIAEPSAV
ncbi:MAG: 2-oxoglutarate and iron-dependent oxygenase domain-containing protein [Pseudomonadota bacterium]